MNMNNTKNIVISTFIGFCITMIVINYNAIIGALFENEYDKKNILFERYLNDYVKEESLRENGYVVIINGESCNSCVNQSIESIQSISDWEDIKLVYCGQDTDKISSNLKDKIYYYDTHSVYFRFNISPDYDPIITIKDKEIVNIQELNKENLKNLAPL